MADRLTDEVLLEFARGLPEVDLSEHHSWTSMKFHGKGFAWLNHEAGSVMMKSTRDECEALIATAPGTFSKGWSSESTLWVRVRLAGADPEEVRELLTEAWRMTATRKAVAAYDASNGR